MNPNSPKARKWAAERRRRLRKSRKLLRDVKKDAKLFEENFLGQTPIAQELLDKWVAVADGADPERQPYACAANLLDGRVYLDAKENP